MSATIELTTTLRKLRDGANGNDGQNAVTPWVDPTSIVYTKGEAKEIALSYGVTDGGTSKNASLRNIYFVQGLDTYATNTYQGITVNSASGLISIASDAEFDGQIRLRLSYGGNYYTAGITVSRVSVVTVVALPQSVSYQQGTASNLAVTVKILDGETETNPDSVSVTTPSGATGMTVISMLTGSVWMIFINVTTSCTYVGSVPFTASYGGNTYSGAIYVSRVLQGETGNDGPAGLTYRLTEWHEKVEYHNDTALLGQQDICYIDCVVVKDTDGMMDTYAKCLKTHPSDASNKPQQTDTDKWEIMSKPGPIYSPLILSDTAVIGFLQGNAIKIFNERMTLKAGVCGASGDYPVFYAHPRIVPIKAVPMYTRVSTYSADAALASTSWSEEIPAADNTNKYVYVRALVTYSDGTTAKTSGVAYIGTNTTGNPIASVIVQYRKYKDSANATTYSEKFCQPDDYYNKVSMRVQSIKSGSLASSGQLTIGTYSASQATETARFQVRDDGTTMVGEPYGAHILLNPEYGMDGSLPRIAITDTDGEISTIFDGSKVSDASELYGSGTPVSASATATSLTLTASAASNTAASSSTATNLATISASASGGTAGFITLASFRVTLSAKRGTYTGDTAAYRQEAATVTVTLDGQTVGTLLLTPDSSTTASTATLTTQARTIPVGAGEHTLQLYLRLSGYNGATATASVAAVTDVMTFGCDRYISRYFANGLCLGSATNNHHIVWDDDGCMCFKHINSAGYGIAVTRTGVLVYDPSNPNGRSI